MSECNLKQDELGERVGKNRTTVTNYLRLLKLPPIFRLLCVIIYCQWAMHAPSLTSKTLISSFTF
jgi:hypothetical protein